MCLLLKMVVFHCYVSLPEGTFPNVSLQRYLWWEQHHVLLVFSRRKANEHFRNHDPHEKGDVQETEHTKRLLDTLLTKTCIFQNNVSSHNHRIQFSTSNAPKNITKHQFVSLFLLGTFSDNPLFKRCFFWGVNFVGGMATHHGTDAFVVFVFFWWRSHQLPVSHHSLPLGQRRGTRSPGNPVD